MRIPQRLQFTAITDTYANKICDLITRSLKENIHNENIYKAQNRSKLVICGTRQMIVKSYLLEMVESIRAVLAHLRDESHTSY